ncbi:MAG: sodium:proton exchanger [Candidatus Zambryskibacteria bacterium CG_4_9_14_3_um_filter_42_9]|uniref:Sodium:proton exchanger n=1 Tax=Candidatus Zambryskibacteria bacterium CG22_combo_CG10-13_8_21_14_all_42_17 TaxID=1975118 RepID=A0A2H0BEK3_9BACT|nr:MAG: sodium:proton exchanger [Candidatus Zambryskibacteria bacterium CG22_combo_CG10-13_8_21_14_all_42_17]PJA37059.1 MAG: sodium:proton exchanger [Candidatus Zambryskibacteria bacterium CG_4_9_14_3_um_filter_42_9]
MTLFTEISLIIVIATIISLIVKYFKQPLIVGYIATGVIVGPYVFDILQAHDEIELFSKIGIAILLFIVGLTLNPDVMREVGKVSFITGIGQVLFTSVIGYFIIRSLGFEMIPATYVAVALTFSSTIIITKLLSDRGDIGKLYGKISVGFLLVQDIIATILLLVVTILGATNFNSFNSVSNTALNEIMMLLGKGTIAAVFLYFISKYILPGVARFVASSQEVLFIFALAWGLGMSALFSSIGFSIEIGALIAGITLAASPFAYEIAARLKPLRDFFIMLFFVLLGSQLIIGQFSALIGVAIILSLFVLIGNPLIVIILMNLMGYRTRSAFMAGLTVAQISEFSLILIALAYSFGHVSIEVLSLVTLVGVITIIGSTYLIEQADCIYPFLKPVLRLITFRKSQMKESDTNDSFDMVIFGYDRVGHYFVETAEKMTNNYMVVDYNPSSIERAKSRGIPHRFGDAEDIDFLNDMNLSKARLLISTIPDFRTNFLLVHHYRESNANGVFITISHNISDSQALYKAGASYVVMPHYLGAFYAAQLIEKHGFSREAYDEEKNVHLQSLIYKV